ncbi:MAG TPA: biotin/lipoyl-containing protein [Thermoanaerobaculia bacterium]|nr:biotin/lipoyl-containing protein [Thermoanaerobaculia bacterium]
MRRTTLVHRGPNGPEEVLVALDGKRCSFTVAGRTETAEAVHLPDGRLSLIFEDGRQVSGRLLPAAAGEVEVSTAAGTARIALAEPLRDRLAHPPGGASEASETEEVRALMPGRVVEVSVSPGDSVAPGALLLVLEAMKMQNEIRSVRGGRVALVDVVAGRPVEGGARLVVLEPEIPA